MKNLTYKMRKLKYFGDINGKKRPFFVFCKLERCMSPRDIARLKQHMLQFFRSVYVDGKEDEEAYDFIISKIFGRQYLGRGKFQKSLS